MKFEKEAGKLYSKLVEEEIDGEKVYFRKRKVYPPLTKDGFVNWKYFLIGNWKSFALVILIVLITLGLIYEYTSNIKIGAECIARENARNISNMFSP